MISQNHLKSKMYKYLIWFVVKHCIINIQGAFSIVDYSVDNKTFFGIMFKEMLTIT